MKSKKQEKAALKGSSNRYGKKGMRHDYLTNEELKIALDDQHYHHKKILKSLTAMRTPQSWEEMLLNSVQCDNDKKFLLDIHHLIKEKSENFRIEILKNLASKLVRGRNHKFSQLLLDMSVLLRNLLGSSSHEIISVSLIFVLMGPR